MRFKAAYTLHERRTKQGHVWHVSWYGNDGSRRFKSTGIAVNLSLKDHGRALAEHNALRIVGSDPRKTPTLSQYAGDFYAWEKSSYVARQHAKGKTFNRQWAQSLQAMFTNHVFPRFGSTKLDALNRVVVEKWLVGLSLSNQTRNQMLYALRTVKLKAKASVTNLQALIKMMTNFTAAELELSRFISARFRELSEEARISIGNTGKLLDLRRRVKAFRDALLSERQQLIKAEIEMYKIV